MENPFQAKMLILLVDFVIVITIFRFFCTQHIFALLEDDESDKLMNFILTDVFLVIERVMRFIALLAPFVIASYLTSVIFYFTVVN